MNLELEIINRECNEILFTLEELHNSIDLIESLLYKTINNKIKVNSQKKKY